MTVPPDYEPPVPTGDGHGSSGVILWAVGAYSGLIAGAVFYGLYRLFGPIV